MEDNLRVIKTSRGGKKAIYKGYMYLRYRMGRKSMFWRCVKRSKCPSIMSTSGENERAQVKIQKEHNHPPDWNSCQAAEFKHKAMEKARTSQDSPDLIVQNLVEASSTEIVANLPKLEPIKRAIRRIRNKEMLQEKSSLKIQNIFSLNKSVNAKLASAYKLLRLLETEVSNVQNDIENFMNGNAMATTNGKCEDLGKRMALLKAFYGDYMEQIKPNDNPACLL